MSEQVEGLRTSPAPADAGTSGDLLEILEQRVSALVHRYGEARQVIQALRTQLKDRDKRIGELNEKVYALARVKADVAKRIDRLIGEIERLEGSRSGSSPGEGCGEDTRA